MQTLVADHPLIAHKLTTLRDISTETPVFRSLTDELVTLLAYEATRERCFSRCSWTRAAA